MFLVLILCKNTSKVFLRAVNQLCLWTYLIVWKNIPLQLFLSIYKESNLKIISL